MVSGCPYAAEWLGIGSLELQDWHGAAPICLCEGQMVPLLAGVAIDPHFLLFEWLFVKGRLGCAWARIL